MAGYYLCGLIRVYAHMYALRYLMIYQTFPTCPLCGAHDSTPYAICSDFMVSKEQFTLLRCPSCGIVYTLDPPDESRIKPYDKIGLDLKLGDAPSGLMSRLYHLSRRRMLKRKARIVREQSYRTGGSLLNFGAGTGFFSHKMEKCGWKVTSVEKYHEKRVFSLEMFHHRMADLPEMDMFHPESFDVITMWHVFEHCYHPHELLDRFYNLLRPGGVLIVACPNICSTDAMHYGPYWAAYDVPRHLWHFNPSSMCNLAARHGFTLMHHEPLPFDSFYISILSEKQERHRMAFLRGFCIGLHSWAVSLAHRGKSSSLVYVFRKKTNITNEQTQEKRQN